MSMVSSGGVTVTIKSKELSKVFLQYHDIVDTFIREEYFPPNMSKVEITDDEVLLSISDVDRQFFCPETLDALIECLVILCTGDEEIIACLEEGDDPEELEEDFGEIVRFAAELYNREDELTSSITSVRWEQGSTDEETGETAEECFTYDQEHGEAHSSDKEECGDEDPFVNEDDWGDEDDEDWDDDFDDEDDSTLEISNISSDINELAAIIIREFEKVGVKVAQNKSGAHLTLFVDKNRITFKGMHWDYVEKDGEVFRLVSGDGKIPGDALREIKKQYPELEIKGTLVFGDDNYRQHYYYQSMEGSQEVSEDYAVCDYEYYPLADCWYSYEYYTDYGVEHAYVSSVDQFFIDLSINNDTEDIQDIIEALAEEYNVAGLPETENIIRDMANKAIKDIGEVEEDLDAPWMIPVFNHLLEICTDESCIKKIKELLEEA